MKTPYLYLLSAIWLGSAAFSHAGEDPAPSLETAVSAETEPFDIDGNGLLSVEERQAYDDALKEAALRRWQISDLLWDRDGNGILSPAEREAAALAIKRKIEAERIARFDELDKNEDGKLSAAEFLGVPNLKPQLVARILDHLDGDRDGFISKAEFLAALDAAPAKTASTEPEPAPSTAAVRPPAVSLKEAKIVPEPVKAPAVVVPPVSVKTPLLSKPLKPG